LKLKEGIASALVVVASSSVIPRRVSLSQGT